MIGARLKSLRGQRRQEDVAKGIGISRARYSHYENGIRQPDYDTLQRIAEHFNVSTDYLLTGNNHDREQLELFKDGEIEGHSKESIFIKRLNELIDKDLINFEDLLSELNISAKEFYEKYLPLTYSSDELKKDILEKILIKSGVYSDYLLGRTNHLSDKNTINGENNIDKEERDIAKRLEKFKVELEHSDGLAFDGMPMSDEAKESLLASMEIVFRETQRINKKYTPKKYRDKNDLGE